MFQANNSHIFQKKLFFMVSFLFLALLTFNFIACSDKDEENTKQYEHQSPTHNTETDAEYTHETGGNPYRSTETNYESKTEVATTKNLDVIKIEILRNIIYVDGQKYTSPDEATGALLELLKGTSKVIELDLTRSKAKASGQFQQSAKAKGIIFNTIKIE